MVGLCTFVELLQHRRHHLEHFAQNFLARHVGGHLVYSDLLLVNGRVIAVECTFEVCAMRWEVMWDLLSHARNDDGDVDQCEFEVG